MTTLSPRDFDLHIIVPLAAYVVLYYDYTLTFATEVERYWGRKTFTLPSLAFLIYRYVAILGHLPLLYEAVVFSINAQRVDTLIGIIWYYSALAMFTQFFTSILLITRIYALYECNRYILAPLVILVATGTVMGCWSISLERSTDVLDGLDNNLSYHLAGSWSVFLALDTVVFGLTVLRAMKIGRARRQPFIHALVADGVMYYGVIFSMNLTNILILLFAQPIKKYAGSILTIVISVVMMSHLMLHLRDPSLIIASRPGADESGAMYSYGFTTMTTEPPVAVTFDTFSDLTW